MGRVPKIPLIKIGVGTTGKGNGQVDGPFRSIRAVEVPVLKSLCFLASKGEAKYDHNEQGKRLVSNYTDRIDWTVLKIHNSIFLMQFQ